MKSLSLKIITLNLLALVSTTSFVMAYGDDEVLSTLGTINRKVDRILENQEKAKQPNQGQDKSKFRSGVDTKCLKKKIDSYPGVKSLDVLESFSKSCRDNFDSRECKEIGKGPGTSCFDLLADAYPGVKSLNAIELLQEYCEEKLYKCE